LARLRRIGSFSGASMAEEDMGMHIDGKKRANFYTFLHSLLIGRSRAETVRRQGLKNYASRSLGVDLLFVVVNEVQPSIRIKD